MCTPVELRHCEERDLEEVYALVVHTILESYPPYYPPRAVQFFLEHHSRDRIAEDIAQALVLVAHHGRRIIGTGTLAGDHVTRVFVDPSLQGSGIGTALMQRIEQEARSLGVNRLSLDASLPAIAFYRMLGYGDSSDHSIDVGSGEQLRYSVMHKSLNAGS